MHELRKVLAKFATMQLRGAAKVPKLVTLCQIGLTVIKLEDSKNIRPQDCRSVERTSPSNRIHTRFSAPATLTNDLVS